ncbi:MAG: sulfatase-like hydrolase/transferase [Pseudomonadota bacterium]|nr:sulfatase-like hydrolase/transferase [Pseudomonadota bacterium]
MTGSYVFWRWAFVFTLLLPSPLPAAKPNILLITADDLGYGDLGSFGHPVIQTPNLDELAEDGLKLTNYYAPSALCSPSRAGLITGRHPYRTGIRSWIPNGSGVFLSRDEITLAETLRGAGYATSHIGKWHLNSDLGSDVEPQPLDQGFDYFYGHNAFQIPTNRNPTNIYRNGKLLPKQKGFTAELYVTEAIEWLKQRDAAKPFFLNLSMAEPHVTFENPAEYNKMYAAFTKGPVVPIASGAEGPTKRSLIPRGPGEYYANITFMDAQLGRLLRWLNEVGLSDSTIVIFLSDNGPVTSDWFYWFELNAHGSTGGLRGRKHFLYEGGIRVPALIRYPNVTKAGDLSHEIVVGMDLFVTLTKLAGGEVPNDRPIDGIDISKALKGGALPDRAVTWALSAVSEIEFAVRRGNWKLLSDGDLQPMQLFNLAEDPLEFFNLIKDNPLVVERLDEDLKESISSFRSDPHLPDTKMKFRFAQ